MKYCKMTVVGLTLGLILAGCERSHKSKETLPIPMVTPTNGAAVQGPLTLKLLSSLALTDLGSAVQWEVEATGTAKTDELRWSTEGLLPTGLKLTGSGRHATISGTLREARTFTATIQATDDRGNKASLDLVITVQDKPLNIATTMLLDALQGQAYEGQIAAVGGADEHYKWTVDTRRLPLGIVAKEDEGKLKLSGTANDPGSYTIPVEVKNDFGQVMRKNFILAVNSVLALNADPAPLAVVGMDFKQSLQVVGGRGIGYSWSIAEGRLPFGLTLDAEQNATLIVRGKPTEAGEWKWTMRVTDSYRGQALYPMRLVITPELTFKAVTLPEGRVGEPYQTQLELTGGVKEGYELVSIDGLPKGLKASFDKAKGAIAIEGTPTATLFGGTVTVVVRDYGNHQVSRRFGLTIKAQAPIIITEALPPLAGPGHVSLDIEGRSFTQNNLNWFADPTTLPPGLALISRGTSASLYGDVVLTGTYKFKVKFYDDQGSTEKELTLDIQPASGRFDLLARHLPRTSVQMPYEQPIQVQGGAIKDFEIVKGRLPAGLRLEKVDALSLRLVGEPVEAGFFRFDVQAVSTQGVAAQASYALAVVKPNAWMLGFVQKDQILVNKKNPAQRLVLGALSLFSVSPDNRWLVYRRELTSDVASQTLYLLDLDHIDQPATAIVTHTRERVNWSPDGTRFATRSGQYLRVYDVVQKKFLDGTNGFPVVDRAPTQNANWSDDGQTLLWCDQDSQSKVSVLTYRDDVPELNSMDFGTNMCLNPRLSAGGNYIVNESGGLVDRRSGVSVWLRDPSRVMTGTPSRIVVGSSDGTLRIYDLGGKDLGRPRTVQLPKVPTFVDYFRLTNDENTLLIRQGRTDSETWAVSLRDAEPKLVSVGHEGPATSNYAPMIDAIRQEHATFRDRDGMYDVDLKTMQRTKVAAQATELAYLPNGQLLVREDEGKRWSVRKLGQPDAVVDEFTTFPVEQWSLVDVDRFETMIWYVDAANVDHLRWYENGTPVDVIVEGLDGINFIVN